MSLESICVGKFLYDSWEGNKAPDPTDCLILHEFKPFTFQVHAKDQNEDSFVVNATITGTSEPGYWKWFLEFDSKFLHTIRWRHSFWISAAAGGESEKYKFTLITREESKESGWSSDTTKVWKAAFFGLGSAAELQTSITIEPNDAYGANGKKLYDLFNDDTGKFVTMEGGLDFLWMSKNEHAGDVQDKLIEFGTPDPGQSGSENNMDSDER
jgi:hypothetical protein